MNTFAGRSALVVVALLVGAWLAVGLRAFGLESDAGAVLDRARAGPVPATEVDAALDDLEAARRLSPDQGPTIREGELLAAAGRSDEARAAARRATDAEPDNLEAWYLTWVVADGDKQAKAHAKRRLLELNPWFSEVLRRASLQRR